MAENLQNIAADWLQKYGDYLYRYALLRVRNEAVAEDLVQDTFVSALQGYSNFAGKSSIKTWLTGILKHKVLDHFRKDFREMATEINDELRDELFDERGHWQVDLADWDAPDSQLDKQQFYQALQHCLDRLPKDAAQLLVLKTMDNLSADECCSLFGYRSTNHLWVSLSRIRSRLRQCMDVKWFNQ